MVWTIGDDLVKTCKEMALIWNVTERSVTKFCNEGKIPGAMKVGKAGQFRMMLKSSLTAEFLPENM